MKRGPIAIDTIKATSAATRTLLTERLGDDLEADRPRSLDEHRVAGTDDLARDRDRLRGRGRPRIGVVAPGQLADTDQDRNRSGCAPDLLVVARCIRPQLRHVAEDRDRTPAVGALLQ